ncbi:MAG: hypothetical protein H0W72_03480 [Planctomycetes bacterium]|nr:hypothetical protein [Planctomycetota bacterium]
MSDLRIASPCHERWDGMTPDGQGRHCASCAKTVVDVSTMAPSQADRFLRMELPERIAQGEHVCVRSAADAAGRLRRSRAKRYLLTNGLAAIIAMSAYGCGGDQQPTVAQPTTHTQQQPVSDPPPPMGSPAPIVDPEPTSPEMGKVAMPIQGEVHMGAVAPRERAPVTPTPVEDPAVMGDVCVPEKP